MKLTTSQAKVLEAMKQNKKDGGNEYVNWQALIKYGVTGRQSDSMDALTKKGLFEKKKGFSSYRLI